MIRQSAKCFDATCTVRSKWRAAGTPPFRKSSFILPTLFFLLFTFVPLTAQRGFPSVVGLLGERSQGLVDGTASIYAGSSDCGIFSSGTASSVGLNGIVWEPTLFSATLGLALRPAWRSSAITFTTKPEVAPWVFDPSVDQATEIDREFQLQLSSQTLSVALLGTWLVRPQIALGFGPEVGVRFAQTARQTDHILGPNDLSFIDGQTTRQMIEGARYNRNPLSFGLLLSGSGTVPIGPRLSFFLEATLRADLLSPVRENEWRNVSLGGSLGLVYHLKKKSLPDVLPPRAEDSRLPSDTLVAEVLPPVAEAPDTTAPVPSPVVPILSASIEVYGLEGDRRRDTVIGRFRERDRRRSLRFVPEAFFEKGSAELPQVYIRNKQMIDSLPTLESLGFLDPLALQERMLDLIGLRLQNNPGSTIGLYPEGEDASLGKLRGAQVRDYMLQVWKIESDRITIEEASPQISVEPVGGNVLEKDQGSKGVLIRSTYPIITAPIISHRLDRDFEAPVVKVTTSHQADAGLRAWDVVLASNDATIAHYSSTQPKGERAGGMNWSMIYEAEEGDGTATIIAQFTVEDSTGARKIARSATPLSLVRSHIQVSRVVDMATMTEAVLYRLPGSFAGVSAAPEYDDILHDIEESVRSGADVILVDRTGVEVGTPSTPSFRKALGRVINEKGLADPRQSTLEEIIPLLPQPIDYIEPAELDDSSLLVLIRQPMK